MPIPSNIQALIDRLNQELDEIEEESAEGINLVQTLLSSFPNNIILIQFFASFSNTLLFVEISRRRIQITINRLLSANVSDEEIQEVGEDLGTELGKALEAKISIRNIINRLQGLQ